MNSQELNHGEHQSPEQLSLKVSYNLHSDTSEDSISSPTRTRGLFSEKQSTFFLRILQHVLRFGLFVSLLILGIPLLILCMILLFWTHLEATWKWSHPK